MSLQDWNAAIGIVAGLATLIAAAMAGVTLHVYLKKEADTFRNLPWVRWVRKYSWAGLSLLEMALGFSLFTAIAVDSIMNPGPASKSYTYWALCSAIITGSGFVQLVADALFRRIERESQATADFGVKLVEQLVELSKLIDRRHEQSVELLTLTAETHALQVTAESLQRDSELGEQINFVLKEIIELHVKTRPGLAAKLRNSAPLSDDTA